MPPVFIGLPVYNGERYVAEAIESVLGQDFGDFEFLISDNASTDGTPEICRYYAAKDKRIRLHRHKRNLGAVANFNFVFESGRSHYFMWMSHDDLLDPAYVGECFRFLELNEDYVLCCSRTTLINEQGEPIYSVLAQEALHSGDVTERYEKHFSEGRPVYCIYGLMRAESVKKTTLARRVYGADRVFICDLMLSGKFHQINRPLRFFRTRTGKEAARENRLAWGSRSLFGSRWSIGMLSHLRSYWGLLSMLDETPLLSPDSRKQLREIVRRRTDITNLIRMDLIDLLIDISPRRASIYHLAKAGREFMRSSLRPSAKKG